MIYITKKSNMYIVGLLGIEDKEALALYMRLRRAISSISSDYRQNI